MKEIKPKNRPELHEEEEEKRTSGVERTEGIR